MQELDIIVSCSLENKNKNAFLKGGISICSKSSQLRTVLSTSPELAMQKVDYALSAPQNAVEAQETSQLYSPTFQAAQKNGAVPSTMSAAHTAIKENSTHVRLNALEGLVARLDDRLAADPVRVRGELGGNLEVLSELVAAGVLPHKLLVRSNDAEDRQRTTRRRPGRYPAQWFGIGAARA